MHLDDFLDRIADWVEDSEVPDMIGWGICIFAFLYLFFQIVRVL